MKPLPKTATGLREYMENKDSSEASGKMDQIRSSNEIGVLADSFSDLVKEMDRYTHNIEKLTSEKERVAAELDLAAKIQDDMLPKIFPEIPDLEIYATMDPATEVGGDFYDFFAINDDHIGLSNSPLYF